MFLLMKKVYVSKTFVVFILGITLALYYVLASDTKDGYWHYTMKFNAYYITPIYLILIAKRLCIFKSIVDLTKIRLEKKGMFKLLFHTSCLHIVLYTFITNIPFILLRLPYLTLFPLVHYLLIVVIEQVLNEIIICFTMYYKASTAFLFFILLNIFIIELFLMPMFLG